MLNPFSDDGVPANPSPSLTRLFLYPGQSDAALGAPLFPMNTSTHLRLFTLLSLPLALPAQVTPAATTVPVARSEEAPVELNPFVVSTTQDVGYRATTSLAGTRINAKLSDLGAAISVVTTEFIQDSAATGFDDLLVYTAGTEVGGVYGNFTNSTFDRGRPDQQDNRTNPEGNTRIRGLVSAELTRDFFSTDFSFDSFNTERVDISRGPNSLLFGVGSPGGVVNYSLKQPSFNKNHHTFSLRMGERGTHREIVDFNEIIVPKRLAVRVSILNDRENYQQEPSYKHDKRFYTAVEAILHEDKRQGWLGLTKLRANFEAANVRTTPSNVIAPVDNIRDWYSVPSVASIVAQTGQAAPAIYTNGTFQPQAMHDRFGANPPFRGSLAQLAPWFITIGQVFNNPTGGRPPLVGFTNPAMAHLQGVEGRVTGVGAFDWLLQSNVTEEAWTAGFTARTFQNTNLYDFENRLITGTTEGREDKFRTSTVTLEQLFQGGKGGIELSFNAQSRNRRSEFPFGDFRSTDVWVDNNLWLTNGQPNPNAGRPLLISRDWGNYTVSDIDRHTYRATGFYDLNFEDHFKSGLGRWLGRHVFSGITEQSTRNSVVQNWGMAVSSNDIDMQVALNGLKNNIRRQLHAAFYVGPDLRSVRNYDDVRFSGVIDAPSPKNGDTFHTFVRDTTNVFRNVTAYADEYLNGGNARERVIDSNAVAWQSHLLDDTVVGMLGYRRDRVRDTLNVGATQLADGAYDPKGLLLGKMPSLDASGNTRTWSVVAHYPQKYLSKLPFGSFLKLPFGADLSVFVNQSENFQPTGFRQDVFLRPIAPPAGETKEKGFNLSFLEDKFNVRMNWYTTQNDNIALDTNLATSAIGSISGWVNRLVEARRLGVPFGSDIAGRSTGLANYYSGYDQIITTLLAMVPDPLRGAANLRLLGSGVGLQNVTSDPVPGLASTSSLVAKGVEIEFVANPTRNWTLALNAAKQETVRSGSGKDLQQYYSLIQQSLIKANLWDTNIPDEPNVGAGITYQQRFTSGFLNPLTSILARDGTISQEQRKWRWNFMTSYKFSQRPLRGFAVGGAIRWQDKAAVGYPVILTRSAGAIVQAPDLAHPYFAPSTWNGDVFVRYKHTLTRKIDWTIQANFRNYLGDRSLAPEVINPDGNWAVVRIPVERTVFLTNTFSF